MTCETCLHFGWDPDDFRYCGMKMLRHPRSFDTCKKWEASGQ